VIFLKDKNRDILYSLATSNNLWEKRISIVATFAFIKDNDFKDTLKISEILLKDEHDLIHKAVGWMLREVGKRNKDLEKEFLDKYYRIMPRTMLRYSIEKFDPKEKEFYMKK
jgi:3-methyladenine DNA glycosylase AlkD